MVDFETKKRNVDGNSFFGVQFEWYRGYNTMYFMLVSKKLNFGTGFFYTVRLKRFWGEDCFGYNKIAAA